MSSEVAKFITRALNPFVCSLATIFVAIFVQQIPAEQKIFWFVLFVLVATVPVGVFYLDYRRGKVTSFWSPEGGERVKVFWAWAGVAFVYTVSAYFLQAPRLIFALGLVLLVLGAINLIASSSFKLSIHSELITLFVLTGVLAVSVNLVYLAVLILAVGWSRIYLKAHSLSEVSFGAFAAVTLVYFVFSLFGLATF